MKTIVLIEPGAAQTIYPPIGLMHIAAALRDSYRIVIKDYSGEQLDKEKIRKDLEKEDPFVVGIRVLTGPPIPRALEISKIAKELNKIVVWGGPHPTILPQQTLENPYIDAVVIGEGEYTFQNLLKYFQGKKIKLEGVGIKKKGKISIMPAPKKFVKIDDIPLPAWDLVENINRYFPYKNDNSLPISTTRGCAFKCGFCHNSNSNVKCYLGPYRIANPQRAIDEFRFVQSLVKNKIEIIDVGEDLHLVSKEYAKRFSHAVNNSGLKLKWSTAARYEALDDEIIDLIKKSGCISIMLGVESGCERIQRMNNKVINFTNAVEIAKKIRKSKIFLRNTYIFGHPTETVEELKKTIYYIKNLPSDENLIQLYRPMPGTPYFELCLKSKKVNVPENLDGWKGFGVLGHDTNVSEIPDRILFSEFYRINLFQQIIYWFNQEKFYLRNNMNEKFLESFYNNRFTFKLKEYIYNKK